MLIGLDFDNTIVCYDRAIALVAEELFVLPKGLPRTKSALRDFLVTEGREPEWTAFQGELYGPGMRHAEPSDGSIETMQSLLNEGHELAIISHRSRHPYAGKPYDLHAAARGWVTKRLQSQGLFGDRSHEANVHFYESQEKKVRAVEELCCSIFIDDLLDVLSRPDFPSNTTRILYDRTHASMEQPENIYTVKSWLEIPKVVRMHENRT